jgi:cell division protein FtsL
MSGRAAARTTVPGTRSTTTTTRPGAATPRSTPRSAPRTATRATPSRPELRLVPSSVTVRPRRRVSEKLGSGRAPFVLLVVALLVCTTLGLLILNTAIAVDSLKATELRAANAERAEQVQHLEQQVVSGGAPTRIADAAGKAGLVPAGPAAFLVVAADGSSTLRGTPEPAEAPPAPPAPAAPAPGAAQVPAPAAAGTAGD